MLLAIGAVTSFLINISSTHFFQGVPGSKRAFVSGLLIGAIPMGIVAGAIATYYQQLTVPSQSSLEKGLAAITKPR
jgi:hypothetical protein